MKKIEQAPYLNYFDLSKKTMERKLELLKSKFGMEGIGFIFWLWREIIREKNSLIINYDKITLLASSFGIDRNKFRKMFNFCKKIKLFKSREK